MDTSLQNFTPREPRPHYTERPRCPHCGKIRTEGQPCQAFACYLIRAGWDRAAAARLYYESQWGDRQRDFWAERDAERERD